MIEKSYSSDNRVRNISKSFAHKMAAKTSWHRCETDYVTVTVCIQRNGRCDGAAATWAVSCR